MFLKIVESESVTIYQIETNLFNYGLAHIATLEELDSVGAFATPYHRYGENLLAGDYADHVEWAKFICDGEPICVVMTAATDSDLSAYLMSDSGETIERIV